MSKFMYGFLNISMILFWVVFMVIYILGGLGSYFNWHHFTHLQMIGFRALRFPCIFFIFSSQVFALLSFNSNLEKHPKVFFANKIFLFISFAFLAVCSLELFYLWGIK